MSTFQSNPEDQKEWKILGEYINILQEKLRAYPEYSNLNIIEDNAKVFKSQSEQNKYYNSIYSALKQELALLEGKMTPLQS